MAGSDAQSASLQSPMGAMLTKKGVDGDGMRGKDGTWQVSLPRISTHGPHSQQMMCQEACRGSP